jgi:tellurium resistance protein TerD
MVDIFESDFHGKDVEISDNKAVIGDDINLTAKDPTLKKILIGAGWDMNTFDADALDLDLSIIMVDRNNMTREDADFIFYNNTEAYDRAIRHNGDSRTGAGDGDDETITIDLHGVPFDILKFLIIISLYKGEEKEQNLDMARNVYVRVVNAENAHELIRYELDKDMDNRKETAMIVASVNREGPKWHFTPIGEFVEGGLGAVASRYGLIIAQQ